MCNITITIDSNFIFEQAFFYKILHFNLTGSINVDTVIAGETHDVDKAVDQMKYTAGNETTIQIPGLPGLKFNRRSVINGAVHNNDLDVTMPTNIYTKMVSNKNECYYFILEFP